MDESRSDWQGPLAIVTGGGSIPFAVADSLKVRGRPFVMFGIRGTADPKRIATYPHHWVGIGQIGRLERLAREAGCREIVFIGTLKRPSLWRIWFDWTALMRLPHIIGAFRGGDDHLLRHIGRIFEADGFRMVGAHEVAPQVLMPEGVLTDRTPNAAEWTDIARGLVALKTAASNDVSQAVIVSGGQVMALETTDGTDDMLAQFAQQHQGRQGHGPQTGGVLVKAPKPHQDHRYDLPAVGPGTVTNTARAGLGGIAVVAGQSVIAELDRMVAIANREHIFIVGLKGEE